MRAAFAARIYFVIRRRHFAASGVVKYTRIADGQSRRAGWKRPKEVSGILRGMRIADGQAVARAGSIRRRVPVFLEGGNFK